MTAAASADRDGFRGAGLRFTRDLPAVTAAVSAAAIATGVGGKVGAKTPRD